MSFLADDIRVCALGLIFKAGSGHPGGSLSCADILAVGLEEGWLFDGANQLQDDRSSSFVLSKGHAAPALYAAAFLNGMLDIEDLNLFRAVGGNLQGHPSRINTPWVLASTGSLGQGFSFAVGRALAKRFGAQEDAGYTYCLLGDGELQEGQVWEASMFAAHHKLSKLIAILDYNKLQSDDLNENIMGIEPLVDKFRGFGWIVDSVDGHQHQAIKDSLSALKRKDSGSPKLLIAHTIKGKGVSFMESQAEWHGSSKISEIQLLEILTELTAHRITLIDWIRELLGDSWGGSESQ